MVSFSCENCGDVLTKKKLDSHRNQCRGCSFTCLDCMTHFQDVEYRSHTSCISEAQKYQGSTYKEKKKGKNQPNGKTSEQRQPPTTPSSQALVPRSAMVEDEHVPDAANAVAIVDAPPHAPSPPPMVNVFDYLIGDGGHGRDDDQWESDKGDGDSDMEPENYHVETVRYNAHRAYSMQGFAYGSAPVPPSLQHFDSYSTPVVQPSHSRNISSDLDGKKSDKKRKRAHVDDLDLSRSLPTSNGDVVMTDVPPMLHSGLTGGISRMLSRPEFPPSPDLSNGDAADASPQSPLKRSKRDKDGREREHGRDREHRREKKAKRRSDSDKDERRKDRKKHERRSRTHESTSSSKRSHGGSTQGNGHWERRKSRRRSESPSVETTSPPGNQSRPLKAIEYPGPSTSDGNSKALVPLRRNNHGDGLPQTSADVFMTCLVKGSDSERGVSVWKALKRWRRDVDASEKDMFKGLRVRTNDRGECVLFVLPEPLDDHH